MFPEYRYKLSDTSFKEPLGLYGHQLFDSDGQVTIIKTLYDLFQVLAYGECIVFIDDLVSSWLLYECCTNERCKVICSQNGKAILIRITGCGRGRRSTAWIVQVSSWDSELDCTFLSNINSFYQYCGVGSRPTPGSIGVSLMRMIHQGLRHTGLPIACEKFFLDNDTGGGVQTPGLGNFYNEAIKLDMYNAYLSLYNVHPTGTPIFVGKEARLYPAYFVECSVTIKEDLALGPFPKRNGRGKVNWPTLKGKYDGVYLWSFQLQDCEQAGCQVDIKRGWAWTKFTTDNLQWSTTMHNLRLKAETDFIAKQIKASAVGGMGHHGMRRERYELSEQERPGSLCFIDNSGVPYDLWVVPDIDDTSAYMYHWRSYTVHAVNSAVYRVALHYAKQGRLIALDYDSIIVLETDERRRYAKRQSIEAMSMPPGTWLWEILHNVHITQHRSYVAIEHSKRPGVRQLDTLEKLLLGQDVFTLDA